MATIALVVAVLASAALAALVVYSHYHLAARLSILENAPELPGSRYNAQTVPLVEPLPAEMDVTGAWAWEQERRGVHIPDCGSDAQRAMWAAEASA